MSQEQVLEILKKHKDEWMSSMQISKILNLSPAAVQRNLCVLRKSGFILFKNMAWNHSDWYQYKYNKEGDL
jgi:biotin operon repressor